MHFHSAGRLQLLEKAWKGNTSRTRFLVSSGCVECGAAVRADRGPDRGGRVDLLRLPCLVEK